MIGDQKLDNLRNFHLSAYVFDLHFGQMNSTIDVYAAKVATWKYDKEMLICAAIEN